MKRSIDFIIPLFFISSFLLPSTKTRAQERENYNLSVGGKLPNDWHASFLAIAEEGICAGVLAQGEYRGYVPDYSDQNAPSITFFGAQIGWTMNKWRLPWSGLTAVGFMTVGMDNRRFGNIPTQIGLLANIPYTFIPIGNGLYLGIYARPMLSFLYTSYDHHGLVFTWSDKRYKEFSVGIRITHRKV